MREVNIKVNDLMLVQTHFISAAGRKEVGKFMPRFEVPYRMLEVRMIIWKKGKRVTVNIDQVRVYRPRHFDTISSDSHVETLYEGQRSSNRSSRSHPGKFKGSRKTSSEESNGRKSNKGPLGFPVHSGHLDLSAQGGLLGGLFLCCVACRAGLSRFWIAPAFH
ncbi:uncharacterized protein TNCV_1682971 [Trichonephila clavipes]|nr:uncharacterized protein TNCV_1682971 [Trichonephila clavipes]